MNKLFLLLGVLFVSMTSFSQDDPVLMTIDGKPITKSEFLQIYLKNNDNPKYDKASLDEYVELFKKFKLKVAEAEDLGYDTIPKLVKELAGYQKQLARPYLIDSSKNESLIKEAYERTKLEVRASHILIRMESNASPADTLDAYNRLMAMKKRIEEGEDFAMVAKGKNGSEDPTASSNGGDLGFFNAFQMVYPFEETAYNTKVGEVSNPFRTRFGYHILKVTDTRPATGTMQAAHLMIAANKNSGSQTIADAKKKIEELYALLEKGGNFEELVSKHSDDPSSSGKGGLLPEFGTGASTRMVPEFSEAAFQLKNDGDYSKPVQTDYGFHIIKRISRKEIPSFEEMEKQLTNKVAKDVRANKTQDSFIANLQDEYGFKDKSKCGKKWFYKNIDSTYFVGGFQADQLKSDKTLYKIDGQKMGQQDFAAFLEKNYRSARKNEINTTVDQQYDKWVKKSILEYEETKLIDKHPAYKALTTEYHDGILLYEIMSDKVWNKAMKDSSGLANFHANNKENYRWNERLDASIFECTSKEIAGKTVELLGVDSLSSTTVVKMVNEKSSLNVKYRNGKYDISKTNYLNNSGIEFKQGVNPTYEYEGKFYVVKVREILPPSLKEFDEAKGAITSDYQNYLEAEWLKELNAKHTVVVNEDVLYSIGK